jgi:hypothetical protein
MVDSMAKSADIILMSEEIIPDPESVQEELQNAISRIRAHFAELDEQPLIEPAPKKDGERSRRRHSGRSQNDSQNSK